MSQGRIDVIAIPTGDRRICLNVEDIEGGCWTNSDDGILNALLTREEAKYLAESLLDAVDRAYNPIDCGNGLSVTIQGIDSF